MLKQQQFIPVILGANIGTYSIARSFYEAYNAKSISLSTQIAGPIDKSSIINPMTEKSMGDEGILLTKLKEIGDMYPNQPKILIGSNDWHIEAIVTLHGKLDNDWIIPYVDNQTIQKIISKTSFYDICEEVGVPYPKYTYLDDHATLDDDLDFAFPVVVKPTDRALYESTDFEGKKKVYICENREELEDVVAILKKAGLHKSVILQEYVPGDDSAMRILTLYVGQDGETKLASYGQVLLEDHTPGGRGNPLAIRTFSNDEVVEQAKKIVEYTGFTGVANFDIKYDSRDGKYKFFELNPRLGRSNYYMTVEGHNPVEYYVEEHLQKQDLTPVKAENEKLYTVVPRKLLLKYTVDSEL
ncbi:carboxylate--amine ligase [Salimicrobium flavidum]|uniref:D-aspartate ligase n=1 Tax=Salimicrobium flavidum TaxID=570947 RepID=A0A1N7K9J7_9BACI|nr:hypothetical protein [Salimicrobium flavidum]SIS58263.1 D-aspartate ligase [Salimicrobium flavidum]